MTSIQDVMEFTRKPRKCPDCGHAPVASILYGYPLFEDELEQKINEGKIVIGGCCQELEDPIWKCTQCGLDMFRKE